jgi:hypothetical protein
MVIKRPSRGSIIVFGYMFWYPLAGVTYQFLHYLIGLQKLGYQPYYVEDSSQWVFDPSANSIVEDPAPNIARIAPILEAYGMAGQWAYRGAYEGGQTYGMSEAQLLQLYQDADACLNVTGFQEMRPEHLAIRRRIYVESDPFSSQVTYLKGDARMVSDIGAHDTHFSFGENLGAPDCIVPTGGLTWLPTRQPVALELWAESALTGGLQYTTISTWQNKNKNIEYQGEIYYWTKDREFRPYLDLPTRVSASLELATNIAQIAWLEPMLREYGWSCANAVELSRNMERYRDYIQGSRAEFTVARDQYVRGLTGWFSDRSACYLAAGRPVITQETGFSRFLPTGRGLFAFQSMDEVLAAIEAIEHDYAGHCRAARELAAEYFAAEKVVGSLLDRAGL